MSIEYRKQRVPFRKPTFNGLPVDATIDLLCIPLSDAKSFCFEYKNSKSVAIRIEASLVGEGVDLISSVNGAKTVEEWFPRSMPLDKPIRLSIMAREKYFEISLNGQHLRDFDYRIEPSKIENLAIDGDIGILSIRFSNFGEHLEPPRPGCENYFRFNDSGRPTSTPLAPLPTMSRNGNQSLDYYV